MTDENTREVAIALSQNLISFHKGRCASAKVFVVKTHVAVFGKSTFHLNHHKTDFKQNGINF
jgi:hypothetical protein